MEQPPIQIPVNHTFLPPQEEVFAYLAQAWQNQELTNNGPLIRQLEQELKEMLGLRHFFIVSNGTMALQLALRALKKQGEVITTPFSFVASVSAILWEGCKPVFADIDPHTLCLDPACIEAAIGPETVAIMPTHVYGNACDIDAIESIGKKHGIPVIYDAAHAFGSEYHGRSILSYGAMSCLSMHAFKVFHTVEGGAIATDDDELAELIYQLRYFGKDEAGEIATLGINGKSSEMHAAVGLANLKHSTKILEERRRTAALYDSLLQGKNGLERPSAHIGSSSNHAYYPLIFPSESNLLQTKEALMREGIESRRYFFPSLNTLEILPAKQSMAHSESVAPRILCLPIYPGLSESSVRRIASIILSV